MWKVRHLFLTRNYQTWVFQQNLSKNINNQTCHDISQILTKKYKKCKKKSKKVQIDLSDLSLVYYVRCIKVRMDIKACRRPKSLWQRNLWRFFVSHPSRITLKVCFRRAKYLEVKICDHFSTDAFMKRPNWKWLNTRWQKLRANLWWVQSLIRMWTTPNIQNLLHQMLRLLTRPAFTPSEKPEKLLSWYRFVAKII